MKITCNDAVTALPSCSGGGPLVAFLQGGDGEIRVIGLTPEITKIQKRQPVENGRVLLEARWDGNYRSLPYSEAPILVSNKEVAKDFPSIDDMLKDVNRGTTVAKVASKFRARTQPLPEKLSGEIVDYFDRQDLPKVERYIDSIAPKESAWHKEGEAKRWWEHSERERRDNECIGKPSYEPEAPKKKTKPCRT